MFNWLKGLIMGWRAKREQKSREALDYPWTSHNRAEMPMLTAPAREVASGVDQTISTQPVESVKKVIEEPKVEVATVVEAQTLEVVAEVKVEEKSETPTSEKNGGAKKSEAKKPVTSRKTTGTKKLVKKASVVSEQTKSDVKSEAPQSVVTDQSVVEKAVSAHEDEGKKSKAAKEKVATKNKKVTTKRKSTKVTGRSSKNKKLTPYEFMQTTTIKHIREQLSEQYPEVNKIARKTAMVTYLTGNEQAFKLLLEKGK